MQQIVTDGLEEEIRAGFQKIEDAKQGGSLSHEAVRSIEGDIVRASELRSTLTGEAATL